MSTNNNSAIFNDPRAKRWGTFAKYSALLVVCFFIAPYIWIAIGGLIGLIVAGTLLLGTWLIRPWIYSVAANARLAFVKAEAKKNPVDTLEEDLRRRYSELDKRKTAIETLNGKIRTFSDKVDGLKSKLGTTDTAVIKMVADCDNLRKVYKRRVEKWNEACKALTRYSDEIERARLIWEAGEAAADARESSGFTEDEFFAKLKTDTAFDAIQDAYNQALGSLDADLIEDTETVKK